MQCNWNIWCVLCNWNEDPEYLFLVSLLARVKKEIDDDTT